MRFTLDEIFDAIEEPPINWTIFRKILALNDPEDLKKLFAFVEENMFPRFACSEELKMFVPGPTFPAVSLTGHTCKLGCDHCKGEYLKGMISIESPKEFIPKLTKAMNKGAKGFLISGGCNENGELPFERYREVMKKFRETTGAILNIHPGLMDFSSAFYLEEIGADFISFDFVTDDEIIKNIFHLKNREADDYLETYFNLLDTKIDVIPHILVGGKYGKIDRECDSLKLIDEDETKTIVFISMIPPKDDPRFTAPEITDVAKLILATRLKFPCAEIALGCMRVRSRKEFEGYNLEKLAIICGVDRMAMVPQNVVQWAKEKGISTTLYNSCCAIPKRFLSLFKADPSD